MVTVHALFRPEAQNMPYNTIIMGDQMRYFYLHGNSTGDIYCIIRVSVSAVLVAAVYYTWISI